jgi:hypothetical protein
MVQNGVVRVFTGFEDCDDISEFIKIHFGECMLKAAGTTGIVKHPIGNYTLQTVLLENVNEIE